MMTIWTMKNSNIHLLCHITTSLLVDTWKRNPYYSGWCPAPQELVGYSAGHDVTLSTWQSAPNQALIHKPRRYSFKSLGKIWTCGNWAIFVECLHCFFLSQSCLTLLVVLLKKKKKIDWAAIAADHLGNIEYFSVLVSECVSDRA